MSKGVYLLYAGNDFYGDYSEFVVKAFHHKPNAEAFKQRMEEAAVKAHEIQQEEQRRYDEIYPMSDEAYQAVSDWANEECIKLEHEYKDAYQGAVDSSRISEVPIE